MKTYRGSRITTLSLCAVFGLLSLQGSATGRKSLIKPDSLYKVGVSIGADFLSRSDFLTNETPKSITQIEQGVFDTSGEKSIGIVGESGAPG
jgi:hypothetical protein